MPNGTFKLAEKIVDFMREKPKWALVFGVLIFVASQGTISYGTSFFSVNSAVTEKLAKLTQDAITLKSEIEAERKDRITEITRLKEDGKLLSEDSIKVMIREELDKFEERLVKRLKE